MVLRLEQQALAGETPLPVPSVCRTVRIQAGWSQERVAQAVGISRPTISRYESGEIAPRGAARRLYAALLFELAQQKDTPPAGTDGASKSNGYSVHDGAYRETST